MRAGAYALALIPWIDQAEVSTMASPHRTPPDSATVRCSESNIVKPPSRRGSPRGLVYPYGLRRTAPVTVFRSPM